MTTRREHSRAALSCLAVVLIVVCIVPIFRNSGTPEKAVAMADECYAVIAVVSRLLVRGGKNLKNRRAPAQGRATADNPTKATFRAGCYFGWSRRLV